MGLRQRPDNELGAKFDILAFHDALLLDGPLPLMVLENQVNAWIAIQKTGNVGAGALTRPDERGSASATRTQSPN